MDFSIVSDLGKTAMIMLLLVHIIYKEVEKARDCPS
jgi:hypothetical protein